MAHKLLDMVAYFISSLSDLREVHLSPSLLSPAVVQQLGSIASLAAFTISGRDPIQPLLETHKVHSKLPFDSLQTMETFAPSYFDYMSSALSASVSATRQ